MSKTSKPSERDALLGGAAPPDDDLLLLHAHSDEPYWRRLLSVVTEIVPLSLFSFGGPPSHLALAHDRFVRTKKWLSDERFLEVLSIASAIPGPSSTQVVTSMGLFRAGLLGGLVALFFWMLPGFVVLTAAGVGAQTYLHDGLPVWMRGLAPAAVSLVVIAAVRLWQKAVGDNLLKAFVATASSCIVLATQGLSTLVFPSVMVFGGAVILVGHVTGFAPVAIAPDRHASHNLQKQIGISPLGGALILLVWFAVLIALAVFHPQDAQHKTLLSMFYALYWIGSIIFGGGQVMLPMLLTNFVDLGWVSKEQFLVGFALVQSLPGPMFNISAYLGAVVYGPIGAVVAAAGLFGPGITLFFGLLPLWEQVRDNRNLRIFLAGVNAAACGLIVASIFLLWEKAVHSNADAAIGLATGLMVGVFNMPSPVAIIVGAILAYVLTPGLLNVGQADFCGPQN